MVSVPPQKQRIRDPRKTRAKLLQAAIELISEKGDEGLSLKEAARVAKVSRGVAYQHFEDRDHLLREARTSLAGRLLDSMTRIETSAPEAQVQHFASLIISNRDAATLFLTDALAGRDLDSQHPIYKLLIRLLEQFKSGGSARDNLDVEMLSFIMLGSVASLVMLSRFHTGGNTDALAAQYTAEWMRILNTGIFVGAPQQVVKGASKPETRAKKNPAQR